MSETRYYRVSGTVQGVGFRAATCDKARGLALAGWVRNRPDGDVELVARGPADALDRFAEWLSTGPAMARVNHCHRDDTQVGDDNDPVLPFEIR